MPQNKCRSFGANRDKFGKRVQLNYMGKAFYGTALGGYISFIATILIQVIAYLSIAEAFLDVKNYYTQE